MAVVQPLEPSPGVAQVLRTARNRQPPHTIKVAVVLAEDSGEPILRRSCGRLVNDALGPKVLQHVPQQTPGLSKGALGSQLLVDEALDQSIIDSRCLLDTGPGSKVVEPGRQAQNALARRPSETPS